MEKRSREEEKGPTQTGNGIALVSVPIVEVGFRRGGAGLCE